LTALREDSYEDVRRVLEKDPEAASTVFFDHDWEPPVCTAVRLDCSADIVELVIKHGADINAKDMRGRTPLTILSSSPTRCNDTVEEIFCAVLGIAPLCPSSVQDSVIKRSLAVAEVLVRAGANPSLPDERGERPCDLASACGNNHLVRFWGNSGVSSSFEH
jgi:ankyrin repeat protein